MGLIILLGKSYVLYNSYGGHDFAERIKITYQIRPKWGELFSKKNKSYVTCIRDTRVVTAIYTYFTYLLEKQFQGFHLQDLVNVLRVELDPEVEPHEIAVLFHILASTDKHIF